MVDSAVTLALIGIVGTVITALFKLLQANTKALSNLVESSDKVAKATTKGALEAKERNGHLAEQTILVGALSKKGIELQEQTLARLEKSAVLLVKDTKEAAVAVEEKRVIAAEDRDVLVGHGDQVVQEQHVEHQTVASTETK